MIIWLIFSRLPWNRPRDRLKLTTSTYGHTAKKIVDQFIIKNPVFVLRISELQGKSYSGNVIWCQKYHILQAGQYHDILQVGIAKYRGRLDVGQQNIVKQLDSQSSYTPYQCHSVKDFSQSYIKVNWWLKTTLASLLTALRYFILWVNLHWRHLPSSRN